LSAVERRLDAGGSISSFTFCVAFVLLQHLNRVDVYAELLVLVKMSIGIVVIEPVAVSVCSPGGPGIRWRFDTM